ncbi:hypothetical protein SAMN05428990_1205 [Pseudoxanthomonas sp. YR558]|nr:hypothetical protein SAMN05428990_1205 [Pseudoxanthomonas sp. YR558]
MSCRKTYSDPYSFRWRNILGIALAILKLEDISLPVIPSLHQVLRHSGQIQTFRSRHSPTLHVLEGTVRDSAGHIKPHEA